MHPLPTFVAPRGARRFLAILIAVVLAAACSTDTECQLATPNCPSGTYSSENSGGSCIAHGSSQCDPNSICLSQGGSDILGPGCGPNSAKTCTYGGSSVPSKFCCGGSTVVGSLDCPDNQTYDGKLGIFCGQTCQRPGSECCNAGRCGQLGGVCAPSGGGTVCPDGHPCADPGHVCCKQSNGSYLCLLPGLCS